MTSNNRKIFEEISDHNKKMLRDRTKPRQYAVQKPGNSKPFMGKYTTHIMTTSVKLAKISSVSKFLSRNTIEKMFDD